MLTDDIIFNCKTHGRLPQDQIIKSGISYGKQRYKCKQCMRDFHKNHYEKNKEKVLQSHQDYKSRNPEEYRLSKKKHRIKFRDRYLEYNNKRKQIYKKENAEYYRLKDKERVENMTDSYVKKTITNRSSIKSKDIPKKMVETKRLIMFLKRKIKHSRMEKKNENKND